jgi:hypothetical protein
LAGSGPALGDFPGFDDNNNPLPLDALGGNIGFIAYASHPLNEGIIADIYDNSLRHVASAFTFIAYGRQSHRMTHGFVIVVVYSQTACYLVRLEFQNDSRIHIRWSQPPLGKNLRWEDVEALVGEGLSGKVVTYIRKLYTATNPVNLRRMLLEYHPKVYQLDISNCKHYAETIFRLVVGSLPREVSESL